LGASSRAVDLFRIERADLSRRRIVLVHSMRAAQHSIRRECPCVRPGSVRAVRAVGQDGL